MIILSCQTFFPGQCTNHVNDARYVVSAKDHSSLLIEGDDIDEKYRRDEENYKNLVLQLVVFASKFFR